LGGKLVRFIEKSVSSPGFGIASMDIYFSARDLLQIPNFQHSKSLSTREPNQKLKDPTQPLRLLNKCHKVAPLQLELIQSKPFLFFFVLHGNPGRANSNKAH
jgi:hypothetical protein